MKRLALLLLMLLTPLFAEAKSARQEILIDGSSTMGPMAKSFADLFTRQSGTPVRVSESGSGNGAKCLINGTCDIAAMSRPMKAHELLAARRNSIDPVAHRVAIDCISVIVHPENPLRGLTRQQVVAIYSGAVTNWREVGGPNRRIVVVQRDANSGTQGSFTALLGMDARSVSGNAETAASNGAMKRAVSATPTAIGFVGFGYVDASVMVLSIDGVEPRRSTLQDGSYPLARPLFMYTNGLPYGPLKQFLDLFSSDEGRRLLGEHGFACR